MPSNSAKSMSILTHNNIIDVNKHLTVEECFVIGGNCMLSHSQIGR